MTRIIAAYKKTQLVYCFIIHEHFVSMYCSFVFLYSSTLLHFAICKDSSSNRFQNIAILKLILIFIATLSTLLKVLHFQPILVCDMQNLSQNFDYVHEIYQYLQSVVSLCILTILIALLCNIYLSKDTFVFYLVMMKNICKGYSALCTVLHYLSFWQCFLLYFAITLHQMLINFVFYFLIKQEFCKNQSNAYKVLQYLEIQ